MPLNIHGKKALKEFQKEYGENEGENIFYATMKKKGMEGKQEKKKRKLKKVKV